MKQLPRIATGEQDFRALRDKQCVYWKTAFNALFASIPYQIFNEDEERFFHAVIFLSLKLCGFYIQSEVNVSAECAEAAMQQIHARAYYKQFLGQGKEIYLIALNRSGKTNSEELKLVETLCKHPMHNTNCQVFCTFAKSDAYENNKKRFTPITRRYAGLPIFEKFGAIVCR